MLLSVVVSVDLVRWSAFRLFSRRSRGVWLFRVSIIGSWRSISSGSRRISCPVIAEIDIVFRRPCFLSNQLPQHSW